MLTTRFLVASILLILLLACCTTAAVPPMISYQGKLMQPSGAPVPDGAYAIQFAIYDLPTGGTALWSEPNPSVQVKNGLFSVLIGSINNLPSNIFDNTERYFALKVGTDPEMTPRQKIATVAFSFRSNVAATVDDGAVTTSKVADGAITTDKLADQSVTAQKLVPGAATPAGTVSMFAGATPPAGWLICDGSAVSRTTYAALFGVTGAIYGAGDGSTTFNLPNLQDRFPLGKSGGSSLGATGGASTLNLQHMHGTGNHALTVSEMPSHSHSLSPEGVWAFGDIERLALGGTAYAYRVYDSGSTGGNAAHNHGNTANALSSLQNVMNPYVIVNYMIKT